jgi:hypothetical protein
VVNDLLDPALLAEAAGLLRRGMTTNFATDLDGRLTEIRKGARVDATFRYIRRGGVSLQMHETPTGIRVATCGQNVDLPPQLRDAIRYIETHDSFTASDLPGTHDNDEQLALCVALSQIGVLRIEDGLSP